MQIDLSDAAAAARVIQLLRSIRLDDKQFNKYIASAIRRAEMVRDEDGRVFGPRTRRRRDG